ncbi:hypothetical protein NA57DRAFT_58206 [Rhizodiscina lignyota]|uniref:DUF7626 domain-containing protein n=1 Tax=Rhizodiscina lignyota TaxID=1504668 RepID=A0A9P4IE82_9PEZI|nr:hypothetical protein NA57DRAFT_58206 [Rhizodiscina lignyota]
MASGLGGDRVVLFDADEIGPAPERGGYDDEMADAEDNLDDTYGSGFLEDSSFLHPESLLAGSFGLDTNAVDLPRAGPKKMRVVGGRVAIPKRITADLDSDDELLVNMREAGCTDQVIAETLAKQGRIRYDKKTIASRYMRIKAKMSLREDQRLEDELTDWHEGEDEMLLAAIRHADMLIADESRKLRKRRFQYTAKHLSELKPSTNYSAKACKKRYRDIMNDRAKIPPELDDEPEKRADEKAARILKHLERQANEKNANLEAQERARIDDEQQKMALYERQLAISHRKEAEEEERLARIEESLEKKKKKLAENKRKKTEREMKMANLNKVTAKREAEMQYQREEGQKFNAQEAAKAKAKADEERRRHIARIVAEKTAAKRLGAEGGTASPRGRGGRGRGRGRGRRGRPIGTGSTRATPAPGAAKNYKSSAYITVSDDNDSDNDPDNNPDNNPDNDSDNGSDPDLAALIAQTREEYDAFDMDEDQDDISTGVMAGVKGTPDPASFLRRSSSKENAVSASSSSSGASAAHGIAETSTSAVLEHASEHADEEMGDAVDVGGHGEADL